MLKFFTLFSILTFLCSSFSAWSQNAKIEEFVVTIYDRSMKVVSPDTLKNKYFVVIENRSLSRVVGKVQSLSGKVFSISSIEPNAFAKVAVDNKKGEKVFFIPLAPPFQEAELISGRKTYEIPPRH